MNAPPDSLAQLLTAVSGAAARSLFVALPGIVQSFDEATQFAAVQPAITREREDEFGDVTATPEPVLHSVPVIFPGGWTFRINPGDSVLLIFTSRSMLEWRARGGVATTRDARAGHLHDAIAIPGLRAQPDARPASAFAGDAHVLTSTDVRLGSSDAAQPVVRGEAYRSAEDTLLTALGVFATAIGALNPATASAAATTMNNAITDFKDAAASYLTSNVKVP